MESDSRESSTRNQLGVDANADEGYVGYAGPSERTLLQQLGDLELRRPALEQQIAEIEGETSTLEILAADLAKEITAIEERLAGISGETAATERQKADLAMEMYHVMEQMRDQERAMRDLERAKIYIMEQMRDLERAKAAFPSEFHQCKDLLHFLRILDRFGIEQVPDDHLIWVKANGSSPDVELKRRRQEEDSKSKSANSTKWELSKFNIHRCAGTASMFDVREWNISGDRMLALVKQKLFGGDDAAADLLLKECAKAINQLRAFFAWLLDRDRKVAEAHCYPVLRFLLEYIIRSLPSQKSREHPEIEVCPGGRKRLTGSVLRQDSVEVTLIGNADFVVARSEPDPTNESRSWLFHVEVKSPTSDSGNAKHQLVGQSEVIAQMKDDRTPVFGFYTNMWQIAVSLRLPGEPGDDFDRVFYNTKSVIDPGQYSIRLLFLFCEFSNGELFDLTRDSLATDSELLDSKQDEHSFEGKYDPSHGGNDSRKPPTTTPTQRPKDDNPPNQMKRSYMSLNDDSDEENEILWEQLRKINEREAHRRGHLYLCQENLDTLPHKSVGLRGELV